MSDVVVTVRLPVEMNDRIVSLTGSRGRSRFIRKAIEAGLRGHRMVPLEKASAVARYHGKKKNSTVRGNVQKRPQNIPENIPGPEKVRSADAEALLDHLLARSRSERDAAKDLDWMPGRVEKAARELSASGAIVFESGMMAVDLG